MSSCKQCGTAVGETAQTCPHCGVPFPLFVREPSFWFYWPSLAYGAALLLIVAGIIGAVAIWAL